MTSVVKRRRRGMGSVMRTGQSCHDMGSVMRTGQSCHGRWQDAPRGVPWGVSRALREHNPLQGAPQPPTAACTSGTLRAWAAPAGRSGRRARRAAAVQHREVALWGAVAAPLCCCCSIRCNAYRADDADRSWSCCSARGRMLQAAGGLGGWTARWHMHPFACTPPHTPPGAGVFPNVEGACLCGARPSTHGASDRRTKCHILAAENVVVQVVYVVFFQPILQRHVAADV
jgi:hypothetical protein